MRFARKLAFALWIGICMIYGINGLERYQREADLFESDMRRDHNVMGRGLSGAVAELWEDEGQARALDILERANQRESQVTIRWVDLAAPPSDPRHPGAPAPALSVVERGEAASWTDREGDGMLYSYIPLRVDERLTGAIEISESLKTEREYLRASLLRMILVFGSLALTTGGIAVALGTLLVGRPIRLLVEKARRVGAGDFGGDLDLKQRDELGELAMEMNAMSRRLAEARDRLDAEMAARIAALEQLRHAERLLTVGKLASGMAHELGTPLNVIHLRASMIASGDVAEGEARDAARVIADQAERITRIVRQLLDFARRRTPERVDQPLARLLERTIHLLLPLARKSRVEMTLSDDGHELVASVDAVQVQQVFTNLLMNGVQAMPGGGRLVLHLQRRLATPPADVGGTSGVFLAVDVRDEGCGIAEGEIERVFDPFFTTKQPGEGTGLGLSVAYGIVREHGGWIEVRSGGGSTTFTVYLPESTS